MVTYVENGIWRIQMYAILSWLFPLLFLYNDNVSATWLPWINVDNKYECVESALCSN